MGGGGGRPAGIARRGRRPEPTRHGSPCWGTAAKGCVRAQARIRRDRPYVLRSSHCFTDDRGRLAGEVEEICICRQALIASLLLTGLWTISVKSRLHSLTPKSPIFRRTTENPKPPAPSESPPQS